MLRFFCTILILSTISCSKQEFEQSRFANYGKDYEKMSHITTLTTPDKVTPFDMLISLLEKSTDKNESLEIVTYYIDEMDKAQFPVTQDFIEFIEYNYDLNLNYKSMYCLEVSRAAQIREMFYSLSRIQVDLYYRYHIDIAGCSVESDWRQMNREREVIGGECFHPGASSESNIFMIVVDKNEWPILGRGQFNFRIKDKDGKDFNGNLLFTDFDFEYRFKITNACELDAFCSRYDFLSLQGNYKLEKSHTVKYQF